MVFLGFESFCVSGLFVKEGFEVGIIRFLECELVEMVKKEEFYYGISILVGCLVV